MGNVGQQGTMSEWPDSLSIKEQTADGDKLQMNSKKKKTLLVFTKQNFDYERSYSNEIVHTQRIQANLFFCIKKICFRIQVTFVCLCCLACVFSSR